MESRNVEVKHAEAIAEAQCEAFTELVGLSDLATRRDIDGVRSEMAEMKFDLQKWIVGLALGQMALIIGLAMKLSH